jgi:hypothetical protein
LNRSGAPGNLGGPFPIRDATKWKPHTHQLRLAVDYNRALAAWVLWMNLCLAGGPIAPPSLFPDYRAVPHDARPVGTP